MNEQQTRKEQAEQNLIRDYPNIDILCNATKASVLSELTDRIAQLYITPSPQIADINKIYSDGYASEKLLKKCITYIFILKESQSPNEMIVRIHASNFYTVCRHNTVNQILCFIADYPSMKQYSKGFDYTHFASKFKEFCNEWRDNQNRILEAKYQEQDRLSSLSTGITGEESLREYLQCTYKKGVDIKQGSLYSWNEKCKHTIDKIVGDASSSNQDMTEEFYGIGKWQEEIKAKRKKLPIWCLTKQEIIEFAEETNKPF